MYTIHYEFLTFDLVFCFFCPTGEHGRGARGVRVPVRGVPSAPRGGETAVRHAGIQRLPPAGAAGPIGPGCAVPPQDGSASGFGGPRAHVAALPGRGALGLVRNLFTYVSKI